MENQKIVFCFSKYQQQFLVSITIHKARNLSVLNADTYVSVNFNETSKKTKIFQNSDCPYFNEYFVFEINTNLEDLLKKNLRIIVFQSFGLLRKDKNIGELNVNLSTVWNQKFHSFIKKWGVLEKAGKADGKSNCLGYLQVDLSIVSTHEPPAPAILQVQDDNVIEENLLLETNREEVQQVKYLIMIFEGTFVVKDDYIIQVSFGSSNLRTKMAKYTKHCVLNEELTFIGSFQSLTQMISFQVLTQDCYQWRPKCSFDLDFSEMCWRINGIYNKPEFGPTYIYFYDGFRNNLYFGKLLISIETDMIDETNNVISTIKTQPIFIQLNEFDYWTTETFRINFVLINMDFLNIEHNHMKLHLNCENLFSNEIEIEVKEYAEKMKRRKYVKFNSNVRPLLTMSIKLPDYRMKHLVENCVRKVVIEMEENINKYKLFEAYHYDNFEYQRKSLKFLFKSLKSQLLILKNKLQLKTFKKIKKWDDNYLRYATDVVNNAWEGIDGCLIALKRNNCDKGSIKSQFTNYLSIRNKLIGLIDNIHDCYPDVYLNVTRDKKFLGFAKFDLKQIMFSQLEDAKGVDCGRMKSVLMQPVECNHSCLNCGCIFGRFDIFMWAGSDKELHEFLPQNVVEQSAHKISFKAEKFFTGKIYVHQSKVRPGSDRTGLCDAKLLVFHENCVVGTKVVNQSLSAVWNEVLTIHNVRIFDLDSQNFTFRPSFMMCLFDADKKKDDLIGIGSMSVPIKFLPQQNKNKPDAEINQVSCHVPDIPIKFPTSEKIDIQQVFEKFFQQFPPHLQWISFYQNGFNMGEVLMSAELVETDGPSVNLKAPDNEMIPQEISPAMKKFRLECLFVGIRNAKKMPRDVTGKFKVELSVGDLVLQAGISGKKHDKNLNFLDPYSSGYLNLPELFQYWPPIVIKLLDCSSTKKPITIAASMIRRPEIFFIEDKPKKLQRFFVIERDEDLEAISEKSDIENRKIETTPLLGVAKECPLNSNVCKKILLRLMRKLCWLRKHEKAHANQQLNVLESEYSWWTKFYNSCKEEQFVNQNLHRLKIYSSELEHQKEFDSFNDWAVPVEILCGATTTRSRKSFQTGEKIGTLKCCLRISKCSGREYFESDRGALERESTSFQSAKLSKFLTEVPVLIRVYVIQGINLRSRDVSGQSDAFIKIEYGKEVFLDKANYIPNQCNPIFGRRFQMSGVIPKNHELKISVYDRDFLGSDDLIGSTVIDLEDRVRSKFGAMCGLPMEFSSAGYNAWRNSLLPSEMLTNLCQEFNMEAVFGDGSVTIAGVTFKDTTKISTADDLRERLSLSVLNNFDQIDGIGYNFVPEHVETRPLYREDRPGIEQGKLQMWLEIFDSRQFIPGPVDITPLPATPYELRVIVWNTKDVTLEEKNVFGKRMSDIYVKCWLEDIDKAQFTDIHYRSLTGEGNFNWRMVFHFKYSLGEDMMLTVKKKSIYEKFDTELKVPAVLNVQVWDNDTFSANDFLGSLTVNLSHFPKSFSTADKVSDKKNNKTFENLFVAKKIRGWHPIMGKRKANESVGMVGKIELELEILTESEAQMNPVGLGRNGPNALPPPNRPDTAFNWITNPLKSAKMILWPQIKKYGLVITLILLLVMIVGILLITLPERIFLKTIGLSATNEINCFSTN